MKNIIKCSMFMAFFYFLLFARNTFLKEIPDSMSIFSLLFIFAK